MTNCPSLNVFFINIGDIVLLNLLNELMLSDKMRVLSSILSPFRNEFNKFNNSGALVSDSIYHMTSKLLKIAVLKRSKLCHLFATYNGRYYVMLQNL